MLTVKTIWSIISERRNIRLKLTCLWKDISDLHYWFGLTIPHNLIATTVKHTWSTWFFQRLLKARSRRRWSWFTMILICKYVKIRTFPTYYFRSYKFELTHICHYVVQLQVKRRCFQSSVFWNQKARRTSNVESLRARLPPIRKPKTNYAYISMV